MPFQKSFEKNHIEAYPFGLLGNTASSSNLKIFWSTSITSCACVTSSPRVTNG